MKKALSFLLAIFLVSTLITAFPMTSFAEASAGFCAVGEVGIDKAAVLLPDGSVKTVTFSGAAPIAGTVYEYTADASGVFTFTTAYLWNDAEAGQYSVGNGYDIWRIRDDNVNGDYFTNADESIILRLSEKAVGFIKFSDTSWRVLRGRNMFFFHEDNSDYPGTAWHANIQGYFRDNYMTMIFVDANSNLYLNKKAIGFVNDFVNHSVNSDPLKTLDPTGVGYTAGDKNVVIGGDAAPTYPKVCAVGEVDTENGMAAILLPSGKVINVPFTGEAPAEDTVYTYSESLGVYTFTAVPFSGLYTWRIFDNNSNSCYYDGGSTFLPYSAYSVSFLKTETHTWKVSTENPVIIGEGIGDLQNSTWWANIDSTDLNGDGTLDLLYADDTVYDAANYGKKPSLYVNTDKTAVAVELVPTEDELFASVTADGGYYAAAAGQSATAGAVSFTVKFNPEAIGSHATEVGVYVYQANVQNPTMYSAKVDVAKLTAEGNTGYYRVIVDNIIPDNMEKDIIAIPYVTYGETTVSGTGTLTAAASASDFAGNWLGNR